MKKITKFIKAIFHLLVPTECVVCHADGSYFCHQCCAKIVKKDHHYRKEYPTSQLEIDFWRDKQYLDEVHFFTNYHTKNGIYFQTAVKKMKYNSLREINFILGNYFRDLVVTTLKKHASKPIYLIPVPLYFWRRNVRGFNQSEILAQIFAADEVNIKVKNILRRRKSTPYQSHLNRIARQKNIVNVFIIRNIKSAQGLSKSAPIFIIDDVMTTGATLEAAAQALKQAGFKRVSALVLAHL